MVDIVKYLFTENNPEVVEWENDYVAHNFKNLYPAGLSIFIPGGIDYENYESIFPKTFEESFSDMHKETRHLSSALEVEVVPNLRDVGVDCMPGKVLYNNKTQALFRFDELLAPTEKTDLLCRANVRHLTISDKAEIYNTRPKFSAVANGPGRTSYFYWTMSISQLFRINDGVFAAIFSFADSQSENGLF